MSMFSDALVSSKADFEDYPSIAVIILAHNEAETIGETVKSILNQSLKPREVITIDDCSEDGTGDIALKFGAEVLRSSMRLGSKARAQNFALPHVSSEFVVAVDADTILAPDALEKMAAAVNSTNATAACGFVVPQRTRTLWERGRLIEYLFVFGYFKPVQDWYGKPLICSGCFNMTRTEELRKLGGYPERTLTEDLDLTWTLYEHGQKVKFVTDAVCLSLEPRTFKLMSRQLNRWSHGFVQNFRIHWRKIAKVRNINMFAYVAFAEGLFGAVLYMFIQPMIALFAGLQTLLIIYLTDLAVVSIPSLVKGYKLGIFKKTLSSLPCFLVLRAVNSFFFLKAFIFEILLNRSLTTYEKGH